MQLQNKNYKYWPSVLALGLGMAGLLVIVALDKLYWRMSIFSDGWPELSWEYWVRSAAILLSVTAVLWLFVSSPMPKTRLIGRNGVHFEIISILGVFAISLGLLWLFFFATTTFNILSMEDGLAEWGSALLLFGGTVCFLLPLRKHVSRRHLPKIVQVTLLFFAFGFFFSGMEEVSWFQRVLNVETPEMFENNMQNEINLHNFATDYLENAYYFGTFGFLVVLPLLNLLPFLPRNKYLQVFIPRPFVAVVGALFCAYNFDMWNTIFTQIAFFSSIVVLITLLKFSNSQMERSLIGFTTIVVIVTQFLFLTNGNNFHRLWAVTEYKEFFIAFALLVYAIDVYLQTKQVYILQRDVTVVQKKGVSTYA